MTLARFAYWRPDQYAANNPAVAGEAKGVLLAAGSYRPWPSLTAFSLTLGAACCGAAIARLTTGLFTVYAGTALGLYKYVSATASWTDVTRLAGGAYAVPDDEQWNFAQFGNKLIAVNQTDDVQVIDVDSGTNFAALAGSPPKARYVKSIGDQLWLLGLTLYPNRAMWSGRNDIEYWTAGMRDCDYQDFPDGGFVTGMTALETGLLFQAGTIRRYAATPDRSIYQFTRVEDGRGLLAPASLAVVGRTAYYLSDDGFYATDGAGSSVAIGADKFDDWFRAEVNYARLSAVIGAADPIRKRVFWLFPSAGNTSQVRDRLLCYDIEAGEATHADVDASYLFPAVSAGYTLDTLDTLGYTLDTLPFSLDSGFLLGGAPYLAAADSAHKLAFFIGTNLAARIETGDIQLNPLRRSFVQGAWPVTDAANATISVGTRERFQSSPAYSSAASITADGFAPLRSSARIHRFRMDIAAAESWTHVQGVEPVFEDDGES